MHPIGKVERFLGPNCPPKFRDHWNVRYRDKLTRYSGKGICHAFVGEQRQVNDVVFLYSDDMKYLYIYNI